MKTTAFVVMLLVLPQVKTNQVVPVEPKGEMADAEKTMARMSFRGLKAVRLNMYRGTAEAKNLMNDVQATLGECGLLVSTGYTKDSAEGLLPSLEIKIGPLPTSTARFSVVVELHEAVMVMRTRQTVPDAVSFSTQMTFGSHSSKNPTVEDAYRYVAKWVAEQWRAANP